MPIQKYFAASTQAFYSSEVHGKIMPKDAVEITLAKYSEMLNARRQGKDVIGGAKGQPVVCERKYNLARVSSEARAERTRLLADTDGVMFAHVNGERTLSSAQYAAIIGYRKTLRDWPATREFPFGSPPSKPEFLK